VLFPDFVRALATAPMPSFPSRPMPVRNDERLAPPAPHEPATLAGLFAHLDGLLNEKTLVIADVGEALFAATDLRIHKSAEFLSPAYYTSMGFAVPAAVGAGFADPSLRPIVLVGDGAFHMTGTEVGTCVRYGQIPIVIILNNRGYSTEREILEGPFNDVHEWQYERICDMIGGGVGTRITTQGEFERGLAVALADSSRLH